MRFFTPSMTEATIKTVYRNLSMTHHPDRGGDTATMQDLNREYEEALKGAYRAAGYTEEKAADRWSADRWSMDAELSEVAAEIYRNCALRFMGYGTPRPGDMRPLHRRSGVD